MTDNPNDGTKFSFTIGYHFSRGIPQCEGPIMETVVSVGIGAMYRIGVKRPETEHDWSTLPELNEPKSFDKISAGFDEFGPLCGDIFLFEIFDNEGKCIFLAEFDAKEKCPADGYDSDKLVATSFCYSFKLPKHLQPLAKTALKKHLEK
jgi:hypothetical protein